MLSVALKKRAERRPRPLGLAAKLPYLPPVQISTLHRSQPSSPRIESMAEEKGFEPLVGLPPRRFSEPGASDAISQGSDGMGPLRDQAVELLRRMQDGTCTSGDVARLAADVLANPPTVIAAA